MLTTQMVIDTLKHLNNQYKKIGFHIVGLFGSFAKGENDIFSDIDIAYKIEHDKFYKDDAFKKLSKIGDIKKELEQQFQKKVDLVPFNTNNKYLKDSLNKELIAI
jgi:predicted nucleotidyltransferase